MSNNLASYVSYLRQIESFQLAGIAALLYDYLLLFGSEVDLIWAQEWTLVTLLYAIVRYLSFFLLISNLFYYGNMSWTPTVSYFATIVCWLMYLTACSSLVWYELGMWTPYIFQVAMDIIMMKRIYALSRSPSRFLNSPRLVVGIMMAAFIVKYALCVSFLLVAIGPSGHLAPHEMIASPGIRVCGTHFTRSRFMLYVQFPAFAFEALLFILAFGYFASDVWASWRSKGPKMWKVNDLVRILVRDSTVYFALNVVSTAIGVANTQTGTSESHFYLAMSFTLRQFLQYCFPPRLIINVKKEYANRVHMSQLGGDLSEIRFEEGVLPQPESTRQADAGFV